MMLTLLVHQVKDCPLHDLIVFLIKEKEKVLLTVMAAHATASSFKHTHAGERAVQHSLHIGKCQKSRNIRKIFRSLSTLCIHNKSIIAIYFPAKDRGKCLYFNRNLSLLTSNATFGFVNNLLWFVYRCEQSIDNLERRSSPDQFELMSRISVQVKCAYRFFPSSQKSTRFFYCRFKFVMNG